jgi:outer membrane lipoprotein-sorting protein
MRKVLSMLALGSICFTTQPTMAQGDAKAKTVLDGVSKKVTALKSLKADFSINLTGGKGGKTTDIKKGSLTLKGQKYHVQISGQEIICDDKTVWTYNKEAKEVQVNNYNPAEQTMSPAKLLTNFWDKEYKYSYKGGRKEKGKDCDIVELVPTDAKKQFSKIELAIDKSTSLIAGGSYWEKNGNKYEISVSNCVTNTNIPDTYFTWNAKDHAGVETVDLR